MKGRSNGEKVGPSRAQSREEGVPRGGGSRRNIMRKEEGDSGDQKVRVWESEEAGGLGADGEGDREGGSVTLAAPRARP